MMLRKGSQMLRIRNTCRTFAIKKKQNSDYIFGFHPVLAALSAERRQHQLLYLQEYADHAQKESPKVKKERAKIYSILENIAQTKKQKPPEIKFVSSQKLRKMSGNRPHNGYVLASSPLYVPYVNSAQDIIARLPIDKATSRQPVLLALDSVHDPMNLGAILRSCAFFGVDAVITCPKSSCPVTPVVSKASSGAAEFTPMYYTHSLSKFLQQSKPYAQVIGLTAEMTGPRDEQQQQQKKQMGSKKKQVVSCVDVKRPSTRPLILLAGNEAEGLSQSVKEKCDIYCTIDSQTAVSSTRDPIQMELLDSLNVSNSLAVVLYQLAFEGKKTTVASNMTTTSSSSPSSTTQTALSTSSSIRKATEADIPLILRFIRELAAYEKLEHEVIATENILRQNLFGETQYAHVLIAESDGKEVGFALYFYNFSTFLGQPGVYLEDLYVQPDARGQGLGKLLLAHLAQVAKENHCGRLDWWVLDWNKPAIDFYMSVGAIPMDEWTVFRVTGDALTSLAEHAK